MRQRRQLRTWGFAPLIASLLLALSLAPAHGQDEAARQPIERLNAALLETMRQADELGYAGRYQKLEPVLREVFDFPFMARLAVGSGWRDLSEAEQAEVAQLFGDMSVANFAARFDGYSGQEFEIVGTGKGPRGSVLVETRIVQPRDEPVGINYLLRETDQGWRVIDVLLDAKFSELARQKAEFGAVLREGGYPALIATLEQKIDQLSGEG